MLLLPRSTILCAALVLCFVANSRQAVYGIEPPSEIEPAPPKKAAEPPPKPQPTSAQLASTVLLYGRKSDGILQATGFVVDAERRWIVTTWHFWSVVENCGVLIPLLDQSKLEIAPTPYMNNYFKGKAATPRLVWYDSSSDLALLEVESLPKVAAASLCQSPPIENDEVLALGNPPARNAMWQLESGRVGSHKWSEWTYASGQRIAANVIEFSVAEPLSTGFSGGPLFNRKGEVTGMVVASAKPDGSSIYAVEAAAIYRFLSRSHGHLALGKSTQGYRTTPIRHANLAVGYDSADAWGYLVRGYLRLEQRRPKDAIDDWKAAAGTLPAGQTLKSWQQILETVQGSVSELSRNNPSLISGK